jgi:ribonuclease Z
MEEDPVPGQVNAKLLLERHGIKPGPIFGKIKNGQDVTLEDDNKTVIRAADFLGPALKGRKVCILGDSCNSEGLRHIAQDCDAITHETTLEDEQKDMCISKGHSTPNMAATFAKSINAQLLIITHFSARYVKVKDEKDPNTQVVTLLLDQARKVHDNVLQADDFAEFPIKKSGKTV